MGIRNLAMTLAAAACVLAPIEPAAAQAGRPQAMRIVVGFAPGGGTDVVARVLAEKLTREMGGPVVVENISGAAGSIAARTVARAQPDGRTVLFASSAHAMLAAVQSNLPYDAITDFTAISRIADAPFVIVVHPSLKVETMQQFLALARSKPGQLNYGSGGPGTSSFMATELFKANAGIDLTPIHYRGAGPQLVAMLTGEVQIAISALPTAMPYINDGRLVPLAVTTRHRAKSLPNVPTAAESGAPGYEFSVAWGLLGPANLPAAVSSSISRSIASSLKDPDLIKRLETDGAEPIGGTPEEYAGHMKAELHKWVDLATKAKLKAE